MEKMICLELEQNLDFNKNGFTICNKCNSICDSKYIYDKTCFYCVKSNSFFGKNAKIICFDIKVLILEYFKRNVKKKSETKFLKIEEALEIFTETFKYTWYSKSNMCWYFGFSPTNFKKVSNKIKKIIEFFYCQNFQGEKYKGYTILTNQLKNAKDKNYLFYKLSTPNYDQITEQEVFFPAENLNRNIFLKNLRENLNFWKFD